MSDPLAPFEPSSRDPFDLRKVGHLLRRAGFGASLSRRRELQRQGFDAAIAAVTAGIDAPPARAPDDEALLQQAIALGDIDRIRAFRVWLCLRDGSGLRERISLFWHGHFATSNRKVADPRAMALQQATFDRHGLGPFDELCRQMVRDPALLRWLDNDVSTKGRPNENLARELFELFTLGRGAYTEHDVQQAARALTGHHVRDGGFHFASRFHDDGDKQLFGERGRLGADDVVRLALARPESAAFLAAKWLRFFVHPEPDQAAIDALADCYRSNDRHVGRTLQVLLRSRLFFAADSQRSKVKSPADFVLGTVRALGARAAPKDLAAAMAAMGEVWLEPPSVAGWEGERAWLSPATWLLRSNFAAELFAGRTGKLAPGPATIFQGLKTPEHRAKAALLVLLDGDASQDSRERLEQFARSEAASGPGGDGALLHAATLLPEYQLL